MKAFAALAALALCACAEAATPLAGWEDVAVRVTPAAISDRAGIGARYGALVFRGGLQLDSKNALFGGWSGLLVDETGALIAESDQGAFLSGEVELNEAGDLVGLKDTRIAIMRGETGDPLDGKQEQDAEDITRLSDGRYAVCFERDHRILIYDLDGAGPIAPAARGPAAPQNMDPNEGLEALTQAADGDLVAGREFAANKKPPTQFFKIALDGSHTVTGPAQVRANYALVGLRRLSDGDYLALERFYFPLLGSRSELRLYHGAGLSARHPHLDGPVLARLQKPLRLDNFEGLAVVERPGKPIRIYIISDDNFSADQRTLLYAFDIVAKK
jgi:hypothetical protein